MLRTHTCDDLRIEDAGREVTLCGWIKRIRQLGGLTFIDLRDRYGCTQLSFNEEKNPELNKKARACGREDVLQVKGTVVERESKNPDLPTGDIEIAVQEFKMLNRSKTPPFTIETDTDGGETLRMTYRYLDLRRPPLQHNLALRHRVALETRNYLDSLGFLEMETPFLIKSTPEGARDFVVPSRMHPGEFYALPQSPQTFKQLLMIAGFDRYFQIVRCFRDEDLRADRQPEFTQIDCEMSFVETDDVLRTFEGLIRHLYLRLAGVELQAFQRMDYEDAMNTYGSDKPDLRFGMPLCEITSLVKGKGFPLFDQAGYVGAICVRNAAAYSRKQLDELSGFVKKPQIGASGLVYLKCLEDGTFKSSAAKFFSPGEFEKWANSCKAKAGDLLLILSGEKTQTLNALGALRLEMGKRMQLIRPGHIAPVWITGFPLFEWDHNGQRWNAVHHPFTAPLPEDAALLDTDPACVKAAAYDMVINGIEIGGGSIRIHDKNLQLKALRLLGFSPEEAEKQFGFLMHALEFGAPPHGGIAFGFDRLTALFGGSSSIRDYIAFPKNNAGRDLMIDSPAPLSADQLKELFLSIKK